MFGIAFSQREAETDFSRAVERCGLRTMPADFRFAGSSSEGLQRLFGRSYVCGRYGDAVATAKSMMVLFRLQPELQENECIIIARLLSLLQAGDKEGMRELVLSLDEVRDVTPAKDSE